jgi:hypothetical protein
VIAYKFLAADRFATLSGVTWPEPGSWLEASGKLERCFSGIHALRPQELLGWIDDELWRCELGGAIDEDADVLVAERGGSSHVSRRGTKSVPMTSPASVLPENGDSLSTHSAAKVMRRRRANSMVSTLLASRRQPQALRRVCRSKQQGSS